MMEEFDDIEKELWKKLGKIDTPQPNDDAKTRFNAILYTFKQEEEVKKARFFDTIWEKLIPLVTLKSKNNWAFVMLLLVVSGTVGYFIGQPEKHLAANQTEVGRLSAEVQEMKQMMMLTMLENPEATERLKAVSYTEELNSVDDQVIEALLTTLNLDQNENVRLVTLEALIKLADNPKVRQGLVQSLLTQQSPLMQVALADAMVKLQEKGSVKQFKQMLKKEDLNEAVKGKIEKTILILS
jgi:hypothetical protein